MRIYYFGTLIEDTNENEEHDEQRMVNDESAAHSEKTGAQQLIDIVIPKKPFITNSSNRMTLRVQGA